MHRVDAPDLVAREDAALDRTGSLRFDVGCGDGRIPALYTSPEVAVVDSSRDAVERAAGRGLEAQVADALELPFEDSSFDVVTCSHALCHVRDIDRESSAA